VAFKAGHAQPIDLMPFFLDPNSADRDHAQEIVELVLPHPSQ
jgi:hypothetical protein